MATAIREMHVRGAGLIGASAAYGMYLAAVKTADMAAATDFDRHLAEAAAQLKATRPTAMNLTWAIERVPAGLAGKKKFFFEGKNVPAPPNVKKNVAKKEEKSREVW